MRTTREQGRGNIGKGPKGWRRSDDRIRDEACEALYRSRDVDASDIEVLVDNGTVCLKGEVQDRQTKRLAEEAVENLHGVDDVRNELRIKRESANPEHGQVFNTGHRGQQAGDQAQERPSSLS